VRTGKRIWTTRRRERWSAYSRSERASKQGSSSPRGRVEFDTASSWVEKAGMALTTRGVVAESSVQRARRCIVDRFRGGGSRSQNASADPAAFLHPLSSGLAQAQKARFHRNLRVQQDGVGKFFISA
jgi:hypothetical protein